MFVGDNPVPGSMKEQQRLPVGLYDGQIVERIFNEKRRNQVTRGESFDTGKRRDEDECA